MKKQLILVSIAVLFAACTPQTSIEEATVNEVKSQSSSAQITQSLFKQFHVYNDVDSKNRYTPSGYMPDGECLYVDQAWYLDCADGKTCIKVSYDLACSRRRQRWAGIYWLNPPDNWGNKKGGYNLTGATRLIFSARGEKGGERVEEFKIGGVGVTADFPDSDRAAIGPVILSSDWREYVIDLRGKDLSNIAGGFAWSANADYNDGERCEFYLDNIRFE